MSESLHTDAAPPEYVPCSDALATLHTYRRWIFRGVLAGVLGYALLAGLFYFLAPSERVTSQSFRLEFDGLELGEYPNGVRFASGDIVGGPILRRVFEKNQLGRFITFEDFSRSVSVIESNPAYEVVAAAYQARLRDPKLSAIDRDRIQKEWDAKAAALSKNAFTINYFNSSRSKIPSAEVEKALTTILREWAAFAIDEQSVLSHRTDVWSPAVLQNMMKGDEPVLMLSILRAKINLVMENVERFLKIPGSLALRSRSGDHVSLPEIRIRLEELIRFRVDPAISVACSTGAIRDRAGTERFLETQLAAEQRRLGGIELRAHTIREALSLYSLDSPRSTPAPSDAAASEPKGESPAGSREALRGTAATEPRQIDSFIDRLVALTTQASGASYRQALLDDLRMEQAHAEPRRASIEHMENVLEQVRRAPAGSTGQQAAAIEAEIQRTAKEVQLLVLQMGEIYDRLSTNLNPSRDIYSPMGQASTRTVRTVSLRWLILAGLIGTLGLLVAAVLLALAHARYVRARQ